MTILNDFLDQKYQIWLEKSMRGTDLIFDWVNLLYYKCHKINPNCDGWYKDSPDWIKKQKSNNKKDNKRF